MSAQQPVRSEVNPQLKRCISAALYLCSVAHASHLRVGLCPEALCEHLVRLHANLCGPERVMREEVLTKLAKEDVAQRVWEQSIEVTG